MNSHANVQQLYCEMKKELIKIFLFSISMYNVALADFLRFVLSLLYIYFTLSSKLRFKSFLAPSKFLEQLKSYHQKFAEIVWTCNEMTLSNVNFYFCFIFVFYFIVWKEVEKNLLAEPCSDVKIITSVSKVIKSVIINKFCKIYTIINSDKSLLALNLKFYQRVFHFSYCKNY